MRPAAVGRRRGALQDASITIVAQEKRSQLRLAAAHRWVTVASAIASVHAVVQRGGGWPTVGE